MWLKADSYSRDLDDKRHYDLEMARQLDADDVYFYDSLTALIWSHLATGKDFYEHDASKATPEVVKAFKKTYNPEPLPTIIK